MHLHHVTAIEERHLSGIDCDRYSAVYNVSTLVGLKTNRYNLGEYSVLLVQELRNSPLEMEEIMSSTSLLCLHKSLMLRPMILSEKFRSACARITVIFISNFYFIPFVLSHQQYLLIFTHGHLSNNANSLQRLSSKLHLFDSAFNVLDDNQLYEFSIHWINLDNCGPIIWQHFTVVTHLSLLFWMMILSVHLQQCLLLSL